MKSQTDDVGHFSITNIMPVSVQLVTLPHRASPYRILSIKIGAVTVYNQGLLFGEVTFGIKPGVPIENIEIKVKPPGVQFEGESFSLTVPPLPTPIFSST